jgi:hypothetical protein
MFTIRGTRESFTLAEARIVVHEPHYAGGGTVTLQGVVKSPDGTKAKWFAVELPTQSLDFALEQLRKAGLQDASPQANLVQHEYPSQSEASEG